MGMFHIIKHRVGSFNSSYFDNCAFFQLVNSDNHEKHKGAQQRGWWHLEEYVN